MWANYYCGVVEAVTVYYMGQYVLITITNSLKALFKTLFDLLKIYEPATLKHTHTRTHTKTYYVLTEGEREEISVNLYISNAKKKERERS